MLLCGCNSRRFCFRTVMNDLSFFLFLWQAFVRLHLSSSCSCCYSLTFSSSFSKVLPFLPRPSCVSPPSCRRHNKIVTRAEKSLMHHLKGVLFGPVRSRSIHTEKRGKKRRIEWFPGKQRKFLASITFSGRIVQDDRLYFVCMFAQTMAAIAQTWGFTLSNSRPKKKREMIGCGSYTQQVWRGWNALPGKNSWMFPSVPRWMIQQCADIYEPQNKTWEKKKERKKRLLAYIPDASSFRKILIKCREERREETLEKEWKRER